MKKIVAVIVIEALISLFTANAMADTRYAETLEEEHITLPEIGLGEYLPQSQDEFKVITRAKVKELTTTTENLETGAREISTTTEYTREIVTEQTQSVGEVVQQNADAVYLAELIESEASIVPYLDEKTAVGLAALYRIDNPNYPNDLVAVIMQPYQFAELSANYSDDSYKAALNALEIYQSGSKENISEDFIYFFGDGKRNYFYNSAGEFYEFEGRNNPENLAEMLYEIQHDGQP